MEFGYTIKKAYFTLDGKPVDPGRLRQNDRLIVSIEGKSADSKEHQTVLVDMLPAGWEIEGPVLPETPKDGSEADDTHRSAPHQTYSFLGALTNPHVTEARDDQFVAAFRLGNEVSHQVYRYVPSNPELPGDAPQVRKLTYSGLMTSHLAGAVAFSGACLAADKPSRPLRFSSSTNLKLGEAPVSRPELRTKRT